MATTKCYLKTIQLLSILLSVCLFSCRDNEFEGPPSDFKDVQLCYRDSIWDNRKIRNALLGTWHWEYVSCVSSPGRATVDSNITIEFQADSFLLLKKLNETIQTSRWEIVNAGSDKFSIAAEPSNHYLYGKVLICDDKAIFDAHDVDVCANYFRKQ